MVALNLVALAIVGYSLFAPVELDIIYNEPFPVSPTVVQRGEYLSWEVEYSKTNDHPATIHRNIICGDNLITLTSSETNAPRTERKTVTGGTIVPEKTSLGVCYVELIATYHINSFREIVRSMRTQDFTVIE